MSEPDPNDELPPDDALRVHVLEQDPQARAQAYADRLFNPNPDNNQ